MLGPATSCAHHDRPATGVCIGCERPLCATCRSRLAGQVLCASCVGERLATPERAPAAAHAQLTAGVLTVVAALVLGILGVGALASKARAEATATRTLRQLEALRFTLDDFYLDLTRYPTREEGLAALVTADPDGDGRRLTGWAGPYLQLERGLGYDRVRGRFVDAWGSPLHYWAEPGGWVYVASAGPNARTDTPELGKSGFDGRASGDDILVWVEGP